MVKLPHFIVQEVESFSLEALAKSLGSKPSDLSAEAFVAAHSLLPLPLWIAYAMASLSEEAGPIASDSPASLSVLSSS